jgi:DNA uptake protein ComE-like DNA-binding protein
MHTFIAGSRSRQALSLLQQQALNVQLMDILNEGTKQEVKKLYGIGPKRADKIIEARATVTFQTVEDLQKAGISAKVARTMRQAFMAQLDEA